VLTKQQAKQAIKDHWQCKLLAIQDRIDALCVPPAERRDAAVHRRHILDVARRLFAEHGVEEVSMHQIAQAARVGQGTLYRRFAHKGELCMALLGENLLRYQADLRAYFESSTPSTSARTQLDHVLTHHVAFLEENTQLLGAVREAWYAKRHPTIFQNPFYAALHQTVETLLQRAVEEGEMPEIDTAFTTDAILAALSIDLYIHQRTEQGFTPERILQGIRRLYLMAPH
jgi:AcrR family transcriptional regulator